MFPFRQLDSNCGHIQFSWFYSLGSPACETGLVSFFNGRVFLCEPFQYITRGILLLEEQAFTAKTGKKIIEKHFIYFCGFADFSFL